MSTFPRIAINHPLTEAARYVNAYAEEHGIEGVIEWLDMHVEVGQLAYLGEQRAIRAVAAHTAQVNLSGRSPMLDEVMALSIVNSPMWEEMKMLLIAWLYGCDGHRLEGSRAK